MEFVDINYSLLVYNMAFSNNIYDSSRYEQTTHTQVDN
jgi:hypothetical protein